MQNYIYGYTYINMQNSTNNSTNNKTIIITNNNNTNYISNYIYDSTYCNINYKIPIAHIIINNISQILYIKIYN